MDLMSTETRQTPTAYRVETDRLVLRCWTPGDAPRLRAALDACDAYLRPWIPFMKDEPRTLKQTAEWLRGIRVAFEIEKVDRVEIMCAPENTASASIPARLGFSHEATLKKRALDSEGGICDLMVWSLFATDYASSPAAKLRLQAYNCMGELIGLN
jgi:RimJ/RimL family protein N-acetyltransferase